MDRSFLAIRQLLQRILAGNDNQPRDLKPAKARLPRKAKSEPHPAQVDEDWSRIEF